MKNLQDKENFLLLILILSQGRTDIILYYKTNKQKICLLKRRKNEEEEENQSSHKSIWFNSPKSSASFYKVKVSVSRSCWITEGMNSEALFMQNLSCIRLSRIE